jgi:hypothetical protein
VNDIHDLLDRAAGDVDPSPRGADDDVLRGRRALRRRRVRHVAGPLAIATVGATALGITLLDTRPPQTGPQHAVLHRPLPTPAPRINPTLAIRLVAYTGQQPAGYRVASVPEGWEIQGADPFALTIAPKGFPDQQYQSFVGKLVVMSQSSDATGTPGGTPRPIGKYTGYVLHTEGIVVCTFQDDTGSWIQLQVPPSLHWSDDDVVRFAEGVEVTGDQQPARG